MCATPPRRKVRARGLVTHTLGEVLPPLSASLRKSADVGGFSFADDRQRPKAKGRPPKAVRPTDEKNGKNRPGSFDFAIWHGIVVSCSGKATRVNTTSPHSPNPHRRDSKRVKSRARQSSPASSGCLSGTLHIIQLEVSSKSKRFRGTSFCFRCKKVNKSTFLHLKILPGGFERLLVGWSTLLIATK